MPCPNSARERSVTIGFRVTPEQARRVDLMARASGMTKQDYLYKRALEEEIVVRPDARVHKMLRDEMARVPGAQAHTVHRRGRRGARLDGRLPRAGVLRHARRGGALGRRAGGRPHLRHVTKVRTRSPPQSTPAPPPRADPLCRGYGVLPTDGPHFPSASPVRLNRVYFSHCEKP